VDLYAQFRSADAEDKEAINDDVVFELETRTSDRNAFRDGAVPTSGTAARSRRFFTG
jgi:hypothetical protein